MEVFFNYFLWVVGSRSVAFYCVMHFVLHGSHELQYK